MSIYPSLEDMKATEVIKAQVDAMRPMQTNHSQHGAYPSLLEGGASAPQQTLVRGHDGSLSAAYPSLRDFMGLELTEEMIRANMPEYLDPPAYQAQALPDNHGHGVVARPQASSVIPVGVTSSGLGIIAPISGSNALVKSMVTHGVRHCPVKKESTGKIGLRVRAMNTGVFVCLVMDNTPAARAGLRFGDQILQIDGVDMAGMTVDKVHTIFKNKKVGDNTLLAVRDRPFERTVTLVRDSLGNIGFQFRDGKIINIVKDSSAARNGLLTEHALLEINGKNVIGLKDKEITKIISQMQGNAMTVTVMPSFLYKHMVKEMDSSLFGKMDHSNPDF